MKIAFKIPPHTDNYSSLYLLAEAGGDEVSFLIFEKSPFTLHGFYTFNFDKNLTLTELTERIAGILDDQEILRKDFAGKYLFYNFKEVTLVPDDYYVSSGRENLCDTMFGPDKRMKCFDGNISDLNIKTVYSIPEKAEALLTAKISNNAMHSVTALKSMEGTVLDCVVYHSTIKIVLFKNGKLQIVQYYDYTNPADVVYHLLNVCNRFNVLPAGLQLLLSGMIAETSGLYAEIYKYFLHVVLKVLPEGVVLAEKLDEHPHHFYTHLTELAQCV